jgi:endonuclease/exonuclease/phosphatase (EEP) superfamily protein YafD
VNKIYFYINIFIFSILFFFIVIDLNLYFNPIDQLCYYVFILIPFYLIIVLILKKFNYLPFILFLLYFGYFKFFYNLNNLYDVKKIEDSNILKVASFNVNFYNDNFNSKLFFKNKENLKDIYCFQEISNLNYKKITSELSDYYISHKNSEITEWSSVIASKYNLIDTEIYNNHTITIINVNNFSFAVVCSHFNVFEKDTLKKLNQILTKINLENILVLGDLNSTPYSFHFKKLLKTLNLNTFYHPLKNFNTWPSFLPNFMRIQIDNIMFRGNFKFSNISIGKNYNSDHLPLYVDLEY